MTNDSLPMTAATALALDAPPAGGGDGSLREVLKPYTSQDGTYVQIGTETLLGLATLARPDHREHAAAGVGEAVTHEMITAGAEALDAARDHGRSQAAGDVYRAMRKAALTQPSHHPEAAAPSDLLEAVKGIADDYMTSEHHHPGYVLIPTAKFEELQALSEAAAPSGSVGDALKAAFIEGLHAGWDDNDNSMRPIVGGYGVQGPSSEDTLWSDSAARRAALAQQPAPQAPVVPGGFGDGRRICEALGFDPANHHNALKCPYCNPNSLTFTPQAPVADTPGDDEPETDLTRINRIERQMREHGGVDSDDMEWMASMTRAALTPPQAARPGDGLDDWQPIKTAPEGVPVEVMERADTIIGIHKRVGSMWWTPNLSRYITRPVTHWRYPAPVQADAAEGRS